MSSNINAKPLDVVFNAGLRQDLDSRTAPVGSLTACDNLEFDQLGRLVRRDGYVTLGTSTLSKTYAIKFPVRRVAQSAVGERLLFTDQNIHCHFPGADKMCQAGIDGRRDNLRAQLDEVVGISASETGVLSGSDAASVAGWTVYATTAVDPTSAVTNVYVDIIDNTTGARVISQALVGQATTAQPRVVVSGGSSTVFVLWGANNINIKYSKIDLSASPIVCGAATVLVNDTEGTAIFDVDTMTSGWCLAYGQNNGTHQARLVTYNATPTAVNSFTWLDTAGTTHWTPTTIAISAGAQVSSTSIVATGYDSVTFKLEVVQVSQTLTGAAYTNVDPGLDHAKTARVMTLAPETATAWMVAFSNYTSATRTTNPRGHVYIYEIVSTPILAAVATFANYTLASKFYRDSRNGGLFAAARFDDPSGFQNHLLLLDFGTGDGGGGYGFPVPHSYLASGRVQLAADNAITPLGGMADLGGGVFQLTYPINCGANQISGNQVVAYQFKSQGSQRYLNTNAQQCLIVAGGTPLIYDGQRLVEQGFYSYPVMGSGCFTPNAAGGSMAQGIYQYRLVYEWTDARGNRHQSPASPAIIVDMSSGTYVAGTNSVGIVVPCLHATRKQQSHPIGGGAADIGAPVRVVPYRTLVGGNTFYRVPTAAVAVNNTSSTADDTSVSDVFNDTVISGNEPLYTKAGGAGQLDTRAPPPTLALTTHQQRLWGVDCENPERIWATKVLAPLVAPSYAAELQILIPGAGRINGLAAQDGKLYALATTGVYLASYGDGPDDTGSGVFPSPQLITTTANCQDPRGVLVGQEGIFFTGTDQWTTGIYQIRRGDGQPTSIGKRVRDILTTYPVCRGVVNRTKKSRTEFLFVDSDTSPTLGVILYYHHDYLDADGIGQWTTASIGTALECLGAWDELSVIADTSSKAAIQTLGTLQDFGSAYPVVTIATADMRPFGLVGYGQQTGFTLLGTATATSDPIKVELSFDSGATWASTDATQFASYTESAGAPVLRQFMAATSKMPSGGAVRVRVSDPILGGSNPGTTYFHGISIEVLPLGGNARLSDAQRA